MVVEESYTCPECGTEVLATTEIYGNWVKSTVYHFDDVQCSNNGDDWEEVDPSEIDFDAHDDPIPACETDLAECD
jgi:hypothetical protein